MSERDQDRDRDLGSNDLEAGEGELDEELESPEDEEAPEEFEAGEEEAAPGPSRRRFGVGRREQEPEEGPRRPVGSVREAHERVHVDDRLSAVFAIVAAGAIILLLAFAVIADYVPSPSVPTLPPLVVPTAQVAPSSSASVAPSVAASPS